MKRLYHKTFVSLPLSEGGLATPLDDKINEFFKDHPEIEIVNISYEQSATPHGVLVANTAFLTYSKEEE